MKKTKYSFLYMSGLAIACLLSMGAAEEPGEEGDCDADCVPGFTTLPDVIECDHGPEHDANCKECIELYIKDGDIAYRRIYDTCCETKAGKPCSYLDANGTPQSGTIPNCLGLGGSLPVCHCFNCGVAPAPIGCEEKVYTWIAHCGINDYPAEGECPTHTPEDPPEGDPLPRPVTRYGIVQVLDEEVPACTGAPGSTNKMKTLYACVGYKIRYADCLTTACSNSPDYAGVDLSNCDAQPGVKSKDCDIREQCGEG